ncbi:sodium- and chloride-dependent glycine transporter 2-like isoform X2 [Ornithodoros turicata]|uniref:sodium- and chloride-dependent glycine transporter 2-like isoform X2 n=1 Tax=Ornithodoros turicata TaxID=34597 RepID=UPI003138D009
MTGSSGSFPVAEPPPSPPPLSHGEGKSRAERSASIISRGNWGNRWEFLLSCVGLSVGIGNVWRFPYLAYQNGGGAFLIPYLIMLLLVGKPMYFMELAIGQFAGQGPLTLWACSPICKGIGFAMVCVSLLVCIYYNVIMAYTIFYMASTFQKQVPWQRCEPHWENCFVRSENISNISSEARTSSQIYWERYVLDLSSGIEEMGGIKWDLALCLLLSWIIVVVCLLKGIKTSGKVVYFAATFPYLILITLLVTGLCQTGAMDGVLYFITPSFEKLLDITVWQAAAGQMFFSLSVSMGGLIMYSSYNKFTNNVFRDAMIVSALDTVTSIISGLVIFSVLGAMAHDLGNVGVEDVVQSGPGLAFVAYPEALARLPIPQLWSVLFFVMLFILGLDSEFALLENVLTSLSDQIHILRKHKLIFTVGTGVFCFFLGLPLVTRGGQYLLEILDRFGGSTALTFIAITESIGVAYVYGYNRLSDDINFMLGRRLGWYWRITWTITSPAILLFIFLLSLKDANEPLTYGEYEFPSWSLVLGWASALVIMLQIPFWAFAAIYRAKGNTFLEKVRRAAASTEDWGPSDKSLKEDWRQATGWYLTGSKPVQLRKCSIGAGTGQENMAYAPDDPPPSYHREEGLSQGVFPQ